MLAFAALVSGLLAAPVAAAVSPERVKEIRAELIELDREISLSALYEIARWSARNRVLREHEYNPNDIRFWEKHHPNVKKQIEAYAAMGPDFINRPLLKALENRRTWRLVEFTKNLQQRRLSLSAIAKELAGPNPAMAIPVRLNLNEIEMAQQFDYYRSIQQLVETSQNNQRSQELFHVLNRIRQRAYCGTDMQLRPGKSDYRRLKDFKIAYEEHFGIPSKKPKLP